MQKVRKLVTTIMIAALITAMEGTTISQLSHYVKADTYLFPFLWSYLYFATYVFL